MQALDWEYAESILHIDLTARTARVEPTSIELKRSYIGGAGFVARLLTAPPAGRPLGPAVAFGTGPLSDGVAGRLAMGTGRPAAGPVALSSMGGRMAAALKDVGFDAVVLTGELSEPGCLLLDQGEVRILPARDLWGMEVPATEAALARQTGPGYASLVVGPAAENRVAFATLAHQGHFAGGSGVAAALGGQRIKALVVRDRTRLPSRCDGCALSCPMPLPEPEVAQAGALGLDAHTAGRLTALARRCADAGILPPVSEPLTEMAHRRGVGGLLAEGEEVAIRRLGPAAAAIAGALPRPNRRGGPGVADLLGTCRRVFQERPGLVLRSALAATMGLLA